MRQRCRTFIAVIVKDTSLQSTYMVLCTRSGIMLFMFILFPVFYSDSFNAVTVKCVWVGDAHSESTSYRCSLWRHGTLGPHR